MILLQLVALTTIVALFRKRPLWPWLLFFLMLLACFNFTVARFPLAMHFSDESELLGAYIKRDFSYLWPSLTSTDMPLFFVIYFSLQKFFFFDPFSAIILMRFGLCVALFLSWLQLTTKVASFQSGDKKNIQYFPFLACFFFMFDWNINYLLLGDELRNALAHVCIIGLLISLFTQTKKLPVIIYFLLACFSHKLGIASAFMLIVSYALLNFTLKNFQKKIKSWHVFLLFPILSLLSLKLFKYGIELTQIKYIISQVNHPIHKGLIEGLLNRKGVILSVVTNLLLIGICLKNFARIKESKIALLCLLNGLFYWMASNYGIILSENFQEPNRFYFYSALFFSLPVALALSYESKKIMAFYVGYFWSINFAFKSYARGVITIPDAYTGSPLKDLASYFYSHSNWPISLLALVLLSLGVVFWGKKILCPYFFINDQNKTVVDAKIKSHNYNNSHPQRIG